jgi:hypothetical protein
MGGPNMGFGSLSIRGAVAARFARYAAIDRVGQRSNSLYVLKHPDYVRDVLVTHASAFGKQHAAFQRLALVASRVHGALRKHACGSAEPSMTNSPGCSEIVHPLR